MKMAVSTEILTEENMKKISNPLFLRILGQTVILVLILFSLVRPLLAEEAQPLVTKIPDSKNQIIKLLDQGIEPASLHMKKEDSIVFFLNSSTDSLATIEVDYGDHTTHCASANLQVNKNGTVTSVRPIEPKNFASVCFHDSGKYPVKVFGLKSKPEGINAEIVVE